MDEDVIQKWCSSPAAVALKTYVSVNVSDVPPWPVRMEFRVSPRCTLSTHQFQNYTSLIYLFRPIDKLVSKKVFQFLTALVKDLHSKQAIVLEKTVAHCAGSSNPQFEAARMLDEFIRSCLNRAGRAWNSVISIPRFPLVGGIFQRWYGNLGYMCPEVQTRVLDLVELCLLTRQMDTCRFPWPNMERARRSGEQIQ